MTEARPPSNSHLNPRQQLRRLVSSELKILLSQPNWSGAKSILQPVTIYSLYVTDNQHCLTGYLSLKDLVTAQPEQIIGELANPHVICVHTDTPQEEGARLIQRYDLLALPVVDTENRLVGIITVDDALELLEAETTKDIYSWGGVQLGANHYVQSRMLRRVAAIAGISILLISILASTLGAAFHLLLVPAH